MTRIAVIYYSATGNVHALARAVADGAAAEGAEVVSATWPSCRRRC
jgi:NAD(P)H dehydrogenase (quinone)